MKIFISYRRDDSAGYAGRLFDHLSARFGPEHIFMDIDTIQPGEDFRSAIGQAVGTCDVVLVLIGKQWLNATDAKGQRRLDNPGDFVRAEVASALANPRVRVIPVLVRDAAMPGAHELPDNLKELAYRNAIELSDGRFHYDVNKLMDDLDGLIIKPAAVPAGEKRTAGIAKSGSIILVLLGLCLVSVVFLYKFVIAPELDSDLSTPTKAPVPTLTARSAVLPTSTFTGLPATFPPTLEMTTPIPTTDPISPAVRTVQHYFEYINNAGVKDDLKRAWELMSNKLQCNPSDQCSADHYINYWWKLQVQYKLFDCGSNNVTAKLIYYTRGGAPNPSRAPDYVTYEVLEDNGSLKVYNARVDSGVNANCQLTVSSP